MSRDGESKSEGYFFQPDMEQLRHFQNSTPLERLRWLDETLTFFDRFITRDQVARWRHYLREGSAE